MAAESELATLLLGRLGLGRLGLISACTATTRAAVVWRCLRAARVCTVVFVSLGGRLASIGFYRPLCLGRDCHSTWPMTELEDRLFPHGLDRLLEHATETVPDGIRSVLAVLAERNVGHLALFAVATHNISQDTLCAFLKADAEDVHVKLCNFFRSADVLESALCRRSRVLFIFCRVSVGKDQQNERLLRLQRLVLGLALLVLLLQVRFPCVEHLIDCSPQLSSSINVKRSDVIRLELLLHRPL